MTDRTNGKKPAKIANIQPARSNRQRNLAWDHPAFEPWSLVCIGALGMVRRIRVVGGLASGEALQRTNEKIKGKPVRKTLIATSALAFAGAMVAGQAAADKMNVGVGGYMEQWFGYANRSDDGADGGFDIQSDSEIYFQGSLEADSGLKFTVHVQLEANNGGDADTNIDESFVRMSGEFGQIEIGQRDPIHARTHYAAAFGAGVGLNAGDTQKWIPGVYLETAGWLHDNLNVIYISPRVSGFQVGVSYGADAESENSVSSAPTDNDDSVWAAGINFTETFGDASFAASLGHLNRSRSSSGPPYLLFNGNERALGKITGVAPTSGSFGSDVYTFTDEQRARGYATRSDDDQTFTNAGVQLGVGGFTFGVSYAARDDGFYSTEPSCYRATNATLDALPEDPSASELTAAVATAAAAEGTMMIDCGEAINGRYQGATRSPFVDDDPNLVLMQTEDKAGQSDTWAVGIGYSDGPLSLSIGHMSHERDNGHERNATMVSAGYKLADGVDWKTSIFGVEDDTTGAEGTVFVTGLDLSF